MRDVKLYMAFFKVSTRLSPVCGEEGLEAVELCIVVELSDDAVENLAVLVVLDCWEF